MNAKRIVIVGLIVWIVDSIFILLTCGWLYKWVYQLPPNIWRDWSTMPATAVNIIGPHVIGIIRALLFALVFAILYKGIPGKGITKGIVYGVDALLYDYRDHGSYLLDHPAAGPGRHQRRHRWGYI
jgi:hypothetical protein